MSVEEYKITKTLERKIRGKKAFAKSFDIAIQKARLFKTDIVVYNEQSQNIQRISPNQAEQRTRQHNK